jgi:hypothetical protein
VLTTFKILKLPSHKFSFIQFGVFSKFSNSGIDHRPAQIPFDGFFLNK